MPSAQASPGPHPRSTLHPICSRPGPQITLSTQIFFFFFFLNISFLSSLVSMQCVSLYVCVCVCIFFLITQYLKSPAVKYKSLFFYQLANRKRDPQNLQMSIFFLLFSWIPFLFFREKKRSLWMEQLYWIPLKRHIAKTMAKSWGKRERKRNNEHTYRKSLPPKLLIEINTLYCPIFTSF